MVSLIACMVFLTGLLQCQAKNVTTYEFLSRPDIVPPQMEILVINKSAVADGYIFVTPKCPEQSNFTWSTYIYNNGGSLVWSGHKFNRPFTQMTVFDVCDYEEAPHLCMTMFEGPVAGLGRGSFSRIVDDTYTQVQAVAPSREVNGQPIFQDLHEFFPVGNGSSALVSSYATIEMNHTFATCAGSPTVKFIKTGLFTEVATDGSNRTLFAWNALDHVDIDDTPLCPGDETAHDGMTRPEGFDFFHINAIDKNEDGDYVVSSRHTWTIYKIAGNSSPSGKAPGEIIWRLGGPRNDFKLESLVPGSGGFNFSYQHHARFIPGGIRFFNNGNSEASESNATGLIPSSFSSSGMEVQLDEDNRIATLVHQTLSPTGALDHSQGSHQKLANGNYFCGMGNINEVFERTADGTLALSASFGQKPIGSYRGFKHPWVGRPLQSELAMFSYAHNLSSPNAYYVSWNGATEVHHYRFYASNSSTEHFMPAATALKDFNFETHAQSSQFGLYSYAEALDADGTVMGRTPTVRTFVPAEEFADNCDHKQCAPYTDYEAAPRTSGPTILFKYVNPE